MGLLSGCGSSSSDSGSAAPSVALGGVAAVGAPIAGGTITVKCAAGSALPTTTTSATGAWQVTITGQTLPCAVQVSGGTINAVLNTVDYHSFATSAGTLNISPITDLVVANLGNAAVPSTWFSGLNGAALNALTVTKVNAALAQVRTGLALAPLNDINPLTVTFNPVSGNGMDDILTALQAALANTNVTLATLRTAASGANFIAPVGFNTALSAGYGGTTSGAVVGAVVPNAPTAATASAVSATQINVSWQAVSGATRYNVYRATAPNVAINATNKVTPLSVTSTAYPDMNGLAAATTYYYKVTALNSAGESVLGSNEATATTNAAPVGGGGGGAATGNVVVITGVGSSARNGSYAPDTATQASGADTDVFGQTSDGTFEYDVVYASNGTIKSAAIWFFGSGSSITFFGCNSTTVPCGNLLGFEPLTKQILFNKVVLSQVVDPFAAGGMVLVAGGEKIQADGKISTVSSKGGGTSTGITFSPSFDGISAIANAVPVTGIISAALGGGTKLTYASSLSLAYRLNLGVEELNITFIGSVVSALNNGGFSLAPGSCAVSANAFGAPLCSSFGINFNKAAGTVSFVNTPMGTGLFGDAPTVFTINGSLTFPPF